MKRMFMTMFAMLAMVVAFAQMPRSEWLAKVGSCALDVAVLKSTITQLSSADKAAFLAEVNSAISKMPGSVEVKAARFLAANRTAVAGAGSADRLAVLTEVFATVPAEYLTVINEEFAKNEFSRPSTMSESAFTSIVKVAMEKIVQRCASAESGAVRAAFAGLMFVRAAGASSSEAVSAIVVAALPEDARKDAKENWFPAALGVGQAQSYDPMLGVAQTGDEPDHAVVISISQPQIVDTMLFDLQSGKPATGISNYGKSMFGVGADVEDGFNGGLNRVPRDRILDPKSPYYYGKGRGEPGPYPGQITSILGK